MATVVSCYYKIPSKRSHDHYDLWIANFMSLPMKTVIFIGDDSLPKKYPANENRHYIHLPIEQFFTSKYDWSYDEYIDKEKIIGHNQLLYKIWNEKPFFTLYASQINPYNTDFFVWVDIGCFRHQSFLPRFQTFPSVQKLHKDKITFLQIDKFKENDKLNVFNVDERFIYLNRIGGTMFACHKDTIVKFVSKHQELLQVFTNKRKFKGMDQTVYAFCILQNPELFDIIDPPKQYDYDHWFYFHDYLS
jgi:hypothetical protein